jgi:hypothetical protein
MKRVTFAVVRYHAYNPPRDQPRATVIIGRGVAMSYEQATWPDLIKVLNKLHPGIAYTIPDEVDLIEYDKRFRRMS